MAVKTAKISEGQLWAGMSAEREKLGKPLLKDDDNGEVPKAAKDGVRADSDYGKGRHERQFAYGAHTVCKLHGFVLDTEVAAGNIHDSAALDAVYDRVTAQLDVKFVTVDAGYKTL